MTSGDAAIAYLTGSNEPRIDAMMLDLVMPGLDGMGVLAKLRDAGIAVPVIVQTAHGGIDNVVSAMRAGAHDFVVKPVGLERLQVSLRNALNASALKGELQRIRQRREGRLTFADIITRSAAMASVLRTAEKAAASSIPVLIEGESGVGKELIARAIHGSGDRAAKPFVAVNCGAIPDNLVESILFGHEKGAFTGATERHTGKFVEASGGTLFLDEVSELPLAAQVKLLRALQEGAVEAVGARKPVKVDVRIISATNRNLLERAKSGHFREDLFYRLHVLPLTVPPLRARSEDVPHLLRHFLARFCAEENRSIGAVSAEAMAALSAFAWPGNVRQLENAVYRAVVISEGATLGAGRFPVARDRRGCACRRIDRVRRPNPMPDRPQPHMIGNDIPIAPVTPAAALSLLMADGEVRPIEEIETDVIRFAIAHYRGQMSEVARRLKIGRSTLYRKLESMDGRRRNRPTVTDPCRVAYRPVSRRHTFSPHLTVAAAVTARSKSARQIGANRCKAGKTAVSFAVSQGSGTGRRSAL